MEEFLGGDDMKQLCEEVHVQVKTQAYEFGNFAKPFRIWQAGFQDLHKQQDQTNPRGLC